MTLCPVVGDHITPSYDQQRFFSALLIKTYGSNNSLYNRTRDVLNMRIYNIKSESILLLVCMYGIHCSILLLFYGCFGQMKGLTDVKCENRSLVFTTTRMR